MGITARQCKCKHQSEEHNVPPGSSIIGACMHGTCDCKQYVHTEAAEASGVKRVSESAGEFIASTEHQEKRLEAFTQVELLALARAQRKELTTAYLNLDRAGEAQRLLERKVKSYERRYGSIPQE